MPQISSDLSRLYLERALQSAQAEARSAKMRASEAERNLQIAQDRNVSAQNDVSRASTKVTLSELGIQLSKIPEKVADTIDHVASNAKINQDLYSG